MSKRKPTLEFDFMKNPYEFGVCMRIIGRHEDGSAVCVEPVTMSDCEQGHQVPIALELSDMEVQNLFQNLWNSGLRPDNGEGNVGQLGATQDHLKDMRHIAFSQMELEVPNGR